MARPVCLYPGAGKPAEGVRPHDNDCPFTDSCCIIGREREPATPGKTESGDGHGLGHKTCMFVRGKREAKADGR